MNIKFPARAAVLVFIVISLLPGVSSAQLHLGGQLTALKNVQEDIAITGMGLHMRYFLNRNLAVGANLRIWPKKYEETVQGSVTARYGNGLGDFAGMLEYYFGENKVRPYIGTDAGIYVSKSILRISDGNTLIFDNTQKKTLFGLSPKIGLGMDVIPLIGFFAQIQYNTMFGTLDVVESNGYESKPIDRFWSFDLGVYLRLGKANQE